MTDTEQLPEPTLEDDISAVFDEIQERQEEPAEEVAQDENIISDEPADIEDDVEPEATEVVTETADETAQEEPDEELTAPENWTQDDREAFSSLDPVGRKVLLDQSKNLERGYNRKFQDMAGVAKEHEEIASLMQPFEAQLNSAGMDRLAGIRALVGAQQMLTQNPAQGLRQLISQYGTKEILSSIASEYGLTEAATGQAEEYRTETEITADNRISQLESTIRQTQLNSQQQRTNEVTNQITLFSTATDDKGSLLHPHFDQVKSAMGAIITGGMASNMDDAYTQAVRANPELWETLITEKVAASNQKLGVARKKTVASAKKASRNPNTRSAAPSHGPESKGLLGDITDIVNAIAAKN